MGTFGSVPSKVTALVCEIPTRLTWTVLSKGLPLWASAEVHTFVAVPMVSTIVAIVLPVTLSAFL